MCGIVGYIGDKHRVEEVLIKGLKRLEYRGYDSCGLALVSKNGNLFLDRVKGRVSELEKKISKSEFKNVFSGIAHTRWATHGIPNEENAHPHTDCNSEIVVVHNGIIENYTELKEKLKGHNFKSETDSEVIAHLIEENIRQINKGARQIRDILHPVFFQAFLKTINELRGSFALLVIWKKTPDIILAARRFSPIIVGKGNGENFVSSDAAGFIEYTKDVYFVNDDEIVSITKDSIGFFDLKGKKIEKDVKRVDWDIKMAEKGGYKHFMLKEIHEQDMAFENTLLGRVLPVDSDFVEKELNLTGDEIKKISSVQFIACGTAYHAAYVGRYVFERFGIKSEVELASEFESRVNVLDKNALVIAISQSGETADTIDAVRLARKKGNRVLAITNTLGSSITRESDSVFYTHCGPEIAVASTKAFIGQLAALYILALRFAYIRGNLLIPTLKNLSNELLDIPKYIREIIEKEDIIKKIADEISVKEDFLFISRDLNYPVALEGALKLKEISYLHAEGYAAGEMKHGPIAIIENDMPVIVIAPNSRYIDLLKGNIQEAKARGGKVIAIVDRESKKSLKPDFYIEIPYVNEIFTPVLSVIPLQLLAYYIALNRKCDIDKPRNLAKSVTVK